MIVSTNYSLNTYKYIPKKLARLIDKHLFISLFSVSLTGIFSCLLFLKFKKIHPIKKENSKINIFFLKKIHPKNQRQAGKNNRVLFIKFLCIKLYFDRLKRNQNSVPENKIKTGNFLIKKSYKIKKNFTPIFINIKINGYSSFLIFNSSFKKFYFLNLENQHFSQIKNSNVYRKAFQLKLIYIEKKLIANDTFQQNHQKVAKSYTEASNEKEQRNYLNENEKHLRIHRKNLLMNRSEYPKLMDAKKGKIDFQLFFESYTKRYFTPFLIQIKIKSNTFSYKYHFQHLVHKKTFFFQKTGLHSRHIFALMLSPLIQINLLNNSSSK